MKRLNYYDLLALVVEYDIEQVKEYLQQMRKQDSPNTEIVSASNDDILKMHGRRSNAADGPAG